MPAPKPHRLTEAEIDLALRQATQSLQLLKARAPTPPRR